jgi:hypothetical protein
MAVKLSVKMYVKTSFFDIMPEVQKDLDNISARIGFCKPVHKKFARNLVKVGEVNFDLARYN